MIVFMKTIIQYNQVVKITLIIPTLSNTAGLLYELTALAKYPLIIVDNAPTIQKKQACDSHAHCTYLPQSKNQGFARAINLALPSVTTDWICILNDDIEFLGTLPFDSLIRLATKNHWAAISPLLTKRSGQVENIGYRVLPQGKVELIFPPLGHRSLDGLTAACLVMQTAVFRDLTGFDGRFFAYLEDVDLFLRLKRAGYQFGVASRVKVIHNHMVTSGKMNNFKAKMDLKNWCFVIAKNWSLHDLLTYAPAIFIERLRNLSGFAKATWRSYSWKSLYIFPRDLAHVIWEIFKFPFSQ